MTSAATVREHARTAPRNNAVPAEIAYPCLMSFARLELDPYPLAAGLSEVLLLDTAG